MPLRVEYKNHIGQGLHLWHISESEQFFKDHTDISDRKWQEVSQWKAGRRREWLAGRFLIHRYASCTSKDLIIDDFGKPQIPHNGEISISHSGDYASIYLDNAPCGVDIQMRKPAITKLRHKYCTDADLETFNEYDVMDALHLVWCSKEAVYKAYGQKEVDYKRHIRIFRDGARLSATMIKDNISLKYELHSRVINNLYLVICRQILRE